MRTREEDFVSHLFVASTHAYIMIFTDRGRAYWLKVHEIPDVGPGGKGKAIANLVSTGGRRADCRAAGGQGVPDEEDQQFIVMGTRKGVDQEDRPVGVQQSARRRHHRDGRRRRRRGDRRRALRRQGARSSSARATAWRSASTKTTSGRWAAPPTASAASRCATTTRSWRWRWCAPGGTLLTVTQNGYGKRTELDEYRAAVARRRRHHQHPDHRAQRQGRRHRLRARRRRADADHPAGHDPADEGRRHPHDRPRHAGRPPDRDGRGRQGRLGGQAGGERRRGSARDVERIDRDRTNRPSRTAATVRSSGALTPVRASRICASSFFCPTVGSAR